MKEYCRAVWRREARERGPGLLKLFLAFYEEKHKIRGRLPGSRTRGCRQVCDTGRSGTTRFEGSHLLDRCDVVYLPRLPRHGPAATHVNEDRDSHQCDLRLRQHASQVAGRLLSPISGSGI